jgi:hypothetical protein
MTRPPPDTLSKFRNLSDRQFNREQWAIAAGSQKRVANLDEAKRLWGEGKMVPHRVTVALDLGDHYGPEVDVACGAVEPDVDRWEAGALYPTWRQVELLSELTGFPPKFFFIPVDPKPMWTSLEYHLPGPPPKPPIVAFKPGARTALATPDQGALW